MPTFDELLDDICKRPAMYVGDGRLFHVALFLDGFLHGRAEHPMASWIEWVELRFGISHPAWHWTSILAHSFGSDAVALSALLQLYKEYHKEIETVGRDAIAAAHSKRFAPAYAAQPDDLPPSHCG